MSVLLVLRLQGLPADALGTLGPVTAIVTNTEATAIPTIRNWTSKREENEKEFFMSDYGLGGTEAGDAR